MHTHTRVVTVERLRGAQFCSTYNCRFILTFDTRFSERQIQMFLEVVEKRDSVYTPVDESMRWWAEGEHFERFTLTILVGVGRWRNPRNSCA